MGSEKQNIPKEEKSEDVAFRRDGYQNLLNKYGTKRDSSTAYQHVVDGGFDSLNWQELTDQYEGNGLFTTIIDAPAEEAVRHDFDLGIEDKDVEQFVRNAMDDVDFEGWLKALNEIGYKGFLTIEREVGEDPFKDISMAVQFLKDRI